MKHKEYYNRKEVAEIMGVTIGTIANWIKKGKMDIVQKVERGAVRIHYTEIPAFKREEK